MKPALGHKAKTLVLVGGGHAHVQVLRRFAMDPPPGARLVVVLDQPIAVYSGMVPGFVAGDHPLSALEIDVVPLARRAAAAVILSAAVDLDPIRREIHFADRPPLRFDLASLDVGSTVRGQDLPGVAEHALSTRPIARFASELEARLARFARAATARDGSSRTGSARMPEILVVGAGAAGCELALALAGRLRGTDPARGIRIRLATAEATALAGASRALERATAAALCEQEIELLVKTRILAIDRVHDDEDEAMAGGAGAPAFLAQTDRGERLAADLVVWATGAAPIAFVRSIGARGVACDASGFLAVRDTLQWRDDDALFAVGDCARQDAHPWVPRAGVYAVRQGPVLERNLRAALAGLRLEPYRPQRDFLALLHRGDGQAIGGKWGLAFSGRGMLRLKHRIDLAFMQRFQVLAESETAASANTERDSLASAIDDGMPCGGCAAKVEARLLGAVLDRLPPAPPDDSVLAGLSARDDVAATRAGDGRITLHNLDSIRAFCDDPYLVGRVAAANALSDLFAKGGQPRHAQALIGLPEDAGPDLREAMLEEALLGLRAVLDPLAVSLLGGHTQTSDVLTIGLAITGEGPQRGPWLSQSGARADDELWLTKPLGTGVVLAADMRGHARGTWIAAAHAAMVRTNATAGRIVHSAGAHAATDVTGFGLAGHLLSLLRDATLAVALERRAIPLLPGAAELFARGLRSTAHAGNRADFAPRIAGASEADEAWLFDPQTSGGLLFALPPSAGPALRSAFESAGEPAPVRIGRFVLSRAGAESPTAPPGGTAIQIVDALAAATLPPP